MLVRFDADGLEVLDGSTLVHGERYQDIIGLFHSHSKEPRWATPDGTSVPLAKMGGRFGFLKGGSDWVTVRTSAGFIPLHVPDKDLARLISEFEIRTGTHVTRVR